MLYVIGLPLIATSIVVRNKIHLHHKKFYTRYGLLYLGYRDERAWWELVIAGRKVTVVLIGTFGTLMGSVDLQAFVALATVFIAIIVHLVGQPFDITKPNGKRLHQLEFIALCVAWFTFWGGLLFFLGQEKSGSVPSWVKITMTILLVSVNSIFFLVSSFLFIREYFRDRKKAEVKRQLLVQLSEAQTHALTEIVPVDDNADEEEEGNDEEPASNNEQPRRFSLSHTRSTVQKADELHQEFQSHEENLRKKHNERQEKSRRNTNLRMMARKKIKQNRAMSKVPMFEHLNEETIGKIVNKCRFKRWKQDDVVCRQGDEADCLYIIASGDCNVSIHAVSRIEGDGNETKMVDRVVKVLKANSFFGESALLGLKHEDDEENEDEVEEILCERNATVTVKSSMMDTLSLSREVFKTLLQSGLLDKSIVDKVGRVGQERSESNQKSFGNFAIPQPPPPVGNPNND